LFQEIAVTAEKWVPIEEVPGISISVLFTLSESQLSRYLQEKKAEGWTLLGVEQTANSCSLWEYSFPEKCVLLLGREKEGIDPDFIQLLDQCIEIPQLGIVR
jgi:tRNA guanosine-2'-O-methyltransferase